MNIEPIIVERTYQASIQKVWKAITDKGQMKEWYFDLKEFRPEVGFEFEFTGQNEDRTYLHRCRVTEVVPGKKITYTWTYEGFEGISFVTFELFKEGDATRLRLTHEGLESFPASNPDFARKNFEQGWTEIIGTSLPEYVETDMLEYEIDINASPAKVWSVLFDNESLPKWASAFGEGTFAETDWKPGSEVTWKDGGGNVGAVGRVTKANSGGELRVDYYDDPNAAPGSQTGEYSESYSISPQGNNSKLKIESGQLSRKYLKPHGAMWESALEKIKKLAEEKV